MSEHKAILNWKRNDTGFGYKEYPRGHQWSFPRSGQTLNASAAVEYLGDENATDPEEAFTAALASCHMLTFLEDEAIGKLEKADDGKPWLAKIVMNPQITFSGDKQPSADDIEKLHNKAHHECFLARSVKTEIVWA